MNILTAALSLFLFMSSPLTFAGPCRGEEYLIGLGDSSLGPKANLWPNVYRAWKSELSLRVEFMLDRSLEEPQQGLALRLLGEVPGIHGGKLRVIRMDRPLEMDGKVSGPDRFRGDPRWLIKLLGPETAAFFGFWQLSETIVLIPDADEANLAIELFNRRAAPDQRILFTFYEPEIDRVSDTEYGARVAQANHPQLPLARQGQECLHDASYHFGGIFLPPRVVRIMSAQHRAYRDFMEFIRVQAPTRFGEVWYPGLTISLGDSMEGTLAAFGRRTDSITGGVTVGFAAENWAADYTNVVHDLVYNKLLEHGKAHSAAEFVKHAAVFLTLPNPNLVAYNELYDRFSAHQRVQDPDYDLKYTESYSVFEALLRNHIKGVVATVSMIAKAPQ